MILIVGVIRNYILTENVVSTVLFSVSFLRHANDGVLQWQGPVVYVWCNAVY